MVVCFLIYLDRPPDAKDIADKALVEEPLPKGNRNNYLKPQALWRLIFMALKTKSACPHKIALGCQMW